MICVNRTSLACIAPPSSMVGADFALRWLWSVVSWVLGGDGGGARLLDAFEEEGGGFVRTGDLCARKDDR